MLSVRTAAGCTRSARRPGRTVHLDRTRGRIPGGPGPLPVAEARVAALGKSASKQSCCSALGTAAQVRRSCPPGRNLVPHVVAVVHSGNHSSRHTAQNATPLWPPRLGESPEPGFGLNFLLPYPEQHPGHAFSLPCSRPLDEAEPPAPVRPPPLRPMTAWPSSMPTLPATPTAPGRSA
jgi:hypothetical protein